MNETLYQELVQKINNNIILGSQDIERIFSDDRLIQLLISKLREQKKYNNVDYDVFVLLNNYISPYENTTYILNGMLDSGQILEIIEANSDEELFDFGIDKKAYEDFLNRNFHTILDNFSNKKNFIVSNIFINIIVENNLYEFAGFIYPKVIDEKIEIYLLQALKEKGVRLHIATPKIKEYCKQNNMTYLISYCVDAKNEEEVNQLFKDIDNGFVTSIQEVAPSVRREYDIDPRLILLYTKRVKYLPDEKEKIEVIKNNPKLIDDLCQLIDNNNVEISFLDDKNYKDIPKLYKKIIMHSKDVDIILHSDISIEEKKEFISNFLENNMSDIYNTALSFSRRNELNDYFKECLKKCTLNEIVRLLDNAPSSAYETIDEFLKESNITYLPFPKDFNFIKLFGNSNQYHNIYKVCIYSATKEQLTPHNFNINVICQNEELLRILTSKLVEYKSTEFNNSSSFLNAPLVLKLLADPSNPLNIDFNTIIYTNLINESNVDVWIKKITSDTKINQRSYNFIVSLCKNNCESAFKLLEALANSDMDFKNIEVSYEYNERINEISKPIVLKSRNAHIYFLEKFNREEIKTCVDNFDDNYWGIDICSTNNKDIVEIIFEKAKERLNNDIDVPFNILLLLHLKGIDLGEILNLLDNKNISYKFDNAEFCDLSDMCKNIDRKVMDKLYVFYGSKMLDKEQLNHLGNSQSYKSDGYRKYAIESIKQHKVKFDNMSAEQIYDIILYDDLLIEVIKDEEFADKIKDLFLKGYFFINERLSNAQLIKDTIIKALVRQYGGNINILVDNFEFNDLSFLITEFNYRNLFEKKSEEFNRIVQIIKPRKLDIKNIKNITESLLGSTFSIDHPDDNSIYVTLCSLYNGNINDEEKASIINNVVNYLPDNINFEQLFKVAKQEGQINENVKRYEEVEKIYSNDKQKFMLELFNLVQKDPESCMVYIHIISSRYRMSKKSEYIKNNPAKISTNAKVNYRKKNLYDKLFNYLLKNDVEKLLFYIGTYNGSDIYNTIYMLTEQSDMIPSRFVDDIKKNMKTNIAKAKEMFYNNISHGLTLNENLPVEFNKLLYDLDFIEGIPIESYDVPKRDKRMNGMFDSEWNLDINILLDKIINNDEKYNCLLDIMEKYKIFDWGDIFDKQLDKIHRSRVPNFMYSFVNAFSVIYDDKKKVIDEEISKMENAGISKEIIEKFKNNHIPIRLKPIDIINGSKAYTEYGNEYKILFGNEDFILILKNEGPNSSTEDTRKRFDRNAFIQMKMMQLDSVSIPSFIKDKDLGENRKLRAIVGNRMDTRNLTHGERTGACMRAYGIGDGLYEFCNTDYRGFHITIEDPETGEYVSRVSGFRNGNTVWLNELRETCSKKYSNKEILEFAKEIARELIERSKDSEMPIVNVAVEHSLAAVTEDSQTICNRSDIDKDIPIRYKNVTNVAVLLASTNPDNTPAPVEFSPDQPKYEPVRLPIKEYRSADEDIHFKIQRITAIKQCMDNKDDPNWYHNISLNEKEFEKEYVYVIIGQDWFVTLDSNLEISYDLIPIDKRAQIELQQALDKVNQYKDELTNGIGGNYK